jgi:hypothetical protein
VKALIRIRGSLHPFAADSFTTEDGWVIAEGRWRWPHLRQDSRTIRYGHSPAKRYRWPAQRVESIEEVRS